jgi:fimbrial chaperone protein
MTRLGSLVALALAVPLLARAGSFEVNPVGLTLSSTRSTGVVTVTNASDSLTVVQLNVVTWAKERGEDVYTPSRNLLATPPIFTLPAGGQQTVRLGLMSKPDASVETAYRLFLQEVPPPNESGVQGLKVLLRVGIPIFVEPKVAGTAPELQWSARRLSATEMSVEAVNVGSAHVQIERLKLSINADIKSQTEPLGYILPGQHASWIFKLPAPLAAGKSLQLSADTDRNTLHTQLVPED